MQELITFVTNHPYLNLAAVVVLLLIMLIEFIRAKRNVFNINPTEATQLINHDNAVVIDIRQQETYRQGHIIDAQLMIPQEIRQNAKKLEKFRNRPIIVVSNLSNESQKIAALLLKQGYNAYSLNGGMRAWNDAQMPLVKG